MKKLFSLILALAMVLALASCGGNTPAKTDAPAKNDPPASSAASSNTEETAEPRIEELWTTSKSGKKIYGMMYLPAEEKETYPTVILSHGFGGTNVDNKLYAKDFVKEGYACYAFDYCGGGRGSQSEGEMTEMSVLTEAEDLNGVMDDILALDYVDKSQLFLLGQSQGGFVSSYVAASRPDDVTALVLYYPAYALQDDAHARTPDPDNIPETENIMNNTLGAIYTRDAISFDIYEVIGGYKGDVQILHGDKDGLVPLSYSERAVEVYENAELTVMNGADHGFTGKTQKDASALTLEFLKAHANQ
ncbi:MAG: alpha/beta fold hydrolase [Oscillospiraceae bacterium]|nr:alpha/beta fold hydrolase [Oscillospiraceae bacterium]